MALPKLDYPIHTVKLKSVEKPVRFRPFLVKEEKILLIAKESEDPNDIRNAVKQILQNCCLDNNVVIEDLALFDIEMYFVHLRMKSIGENVKLSFTCENIVDTEKETKCGHVTDYVLDLNKVKYYSEQEVGDTVKLSSTVGLKLKYPTLSIFKEDGYDSALKVIMDNIVYIYDANSVYKRDTISDEELQEFLDQLTMDQIDQIRTFFENVPMVVLEDEVQCAKCNFKHTIKSGDLYNFFT